MPVSERLSLIISSICNALRKSARARTEALDPGPERT